MWVCFLLKTQGFLCADWFISTCDVELRGPTVNKSYLIWVEIDGVGLKQSLRRINNSNNFYFLIDVFNKINWRVSWCFPIGVYKQGVRDTIIALKTGKIVNRMSRYWAKSHKLIKGELSLNVAFRNKWRFFLVLLHSTLHVGIRHTYHITEVTLKETTTKRS